MFPQGLIRTYQCHGLKGMRLLLSYYRQRAVSLVKGPGRECPICNWRGKEFAPFLNFKDNVTRSGAACPFCGALARHRAYHLFYERFFCAPENEILKRMIHFAPESCLEPMLKCYMSEYVKSNYDHSGPDEKKYDLRDLPLPDAGYDVLVMNRVLSCTPEDRKAAQSMYRVLRPGGVVLAGDLVSSGRPTIEYARIGYGGRRRSYGTLDLAERFSPFEVSVMDASEFIEKTNRIFWGISSPEPIIILRKRAI